MSRTFNRILGIAIAVLAIIGESTRLFNWGLSEILGWMFGTDSWVFVQRVSSVVNNGLTLIMVLGGIWLAAKGHVMTSTRLKFVSFVLLGAFLLQPIQWFLLWDLAEGDSYFYIFENELKSEYFALAEGNDFIDRVTSGMGGILLLLVLILNVVLAMLNKREDAFGDAQGYAYQGGYQNVSPVQYQPPVQQVQYQQAPPIQYQQPVQPVIQQPMMTQQMAAQINQLYGMFQQGILTQDEFEKAKSRILNGR